ncbi:MAG: hypothetical protein NT062_01050 [Proteobacteria bacterium]|nr:hypothetical protein [Pseudomonadota bacterium]
MNRSIVVLALVTACGGKPAPSSTPATPAATATPTSGKAVTVKLVSLTNGDRACYVAIERADGTSDSLEGDFDLCGGGTKDASAAIGKQITYTTEKANVLAASCQGDVDCGKSDQVDLVTTITLAP